MNAYTFDSVRQVVHIASLILFCLVVLVGIVGTFKPRLLGGIFKEFAERKYIIGASVFICLICGTIFTATQAFSRTYDKQSGNTSSNLGQPARQVYESNPESSNSTPVESGQTQKVLGSSTSNNTQNSSAQTQTSTSTSQTPQSVAEAPATSSQTTTPTNSNAPPTNTPQQPSQPSTDRSCKVLILRLPCL